MKWTKRLKWIRLSKVIIPITLAISLVFAGFAVFANEAENFVIKVDDGGGVSLALTYNEDLSEQTDHLTVPVLGHYTDVTWDPSAGAQLSYDPDAYAENIPDDIALQEGVHSVFKKEEVISFFSFSFYLVNNSNRAVTVSMTVDIDELVTGSNKEDFHLDDAVRFMLIDGKHRLSEQASTAIYKKPEINDEEEEILRENTKAYSYYPIMDFAGSRRIVERDGQYTLNPGTVEDGSNVQRFTVVIWLEGWDRECIDAIRPESMKMSMNFTAE